MTGVQTCALPISFDFKKDSPSDGGVRLSYLKRFGQNRPDVGDQSDGRNSFFPPTIRYDEAALVLIQLPRYRGFSLEGRAVYEFKNPSSIFSTSLAYSPRESWSLYASMDVLTSYRSEAETAELLSRNEYAGFISSYAQNDRFTIGVRYVF